MEGSLKKILLPALLLLPLNAQADWQTSMVRVLCMPEPGLEHFSVQRQNFWQIHNYINFPTPKGVPESKDERLEILRSYGLLIPNGFSFTCDLPDKTYKIYGSASSIGVCGATPRTTISLEADGILILDNVYFEKRCSERSIPYITEIIRENWEGWDNRIQLKLSNGLQNRDLFTNKTSITQEDLKCLQNEGFFDPKKSDEAEKKCLEMNSPSTSGD